MISSATISAIREATDLRELAAEYGPVKKLGDAVRMSCQFHTEKTASLNIHEHYFFCFGCNEQGSCFDWVMRVGGFSFRESVNLLAERAGIVINCNTKYVSKVTLAYAKEEAAACAYWWKKKLEDVRVLGAEELTDRSADMGYLSSIFKVNMWLQSIPKDQRLQFYRNHVTSEERDEYKTWLKEEGAWMRLGKAWAGSVESEVAA